MALSLYDASIPVLTLGLTNLSTLLDKGAAHAEAHKVDPQVFADARLIVDMLPLKRQVQIACDTAKGAAGRLAAIEIPKHEDNEATVAELKARIAKTLEFIGSVGPAKLAGADGREIVLQFPQRTLRFTGITYLTTYVLPNFYFHTTMAYAILRQNGVDIGKLDFLGKIQ